MVGSRAFGYDPDADEVNDDYSTKSLLQFVQSSIPIQSIGPDKTGSSGSSNKGKDRLDLSSHVNLVNIRAAQQVDQFVSVTCTDKKVASHAVGFVLFTAEYETPLFVKSLAFLLRSKAPVAEVRASNDAVARTFQLQAPINYPILVAVCGGSDAAVHERFRGSLKSFQEVEKFAERFQGSSSKGLCASLKKEREKTVREKKAAYVKYSEKQWRKLKISELTQAMGILGVTLPNRDSLIEKSAYIDAIVNHINSQKKAGKEL